MGRAISPTENQLKARLLNELRRSKRISASTIVANELPLGTTGVRADLAFYARAFTGIEVKSDRDSLKRLTHQLPIYQRYFDRTILLLGSKHWEEATSLDLSGIELWIASGMSIKRIQNGSISDQSHQQSQLLSPTLRRKYADSQTGSSAIFRTAFCERFKATSKAFWAATTDQPISVEHLPLLSRFVEKREAHALTSTQAKKARDEWLDALVQSLHSSSVSKNDASSA